MCYGGGCGVVPPDGIRSSCRFLRPRSQEISIFLVPLRVFWEAPELVICEGEYSFK
nr:MAG TPA: hypothetical protein [Caudoviricetes sp.]